MATRRERVVLDLVDNMSTGLVKSAAKVRELKRELNDLSGTSVQTSRGTARISKDIDTVGNSSSRADRSINQLTGRLRVLGEIVAILHPAIAPIGAVAVPAISGLANQFGMAALGAGSLMIAFQGVGDATKAVNEYALEPTAKNLEKAQAAMEGLAPEAQAFIMEFQRLRPVFADIRNASAAGWFPGLTDAMGSVEKMAPRFERILGSIGVAGGDMIASGAESLSSSRWADFFDFIEREAPSAITTLGHTVGNLTHGLSEMWEAFDPLNDDFASWLLDTSQGFDQWAQGLAESEGFAEFVEYIRTNGPQVAETLGAVGDALLQVVEASAPLGGPVLKALEAAADVIAAIADSDLGTPILAGVAALSLLNRTLAVTASLSKVSLSSGLFAGVGTLGKGAKSARSDIAAMSDGLVAFGSNADRATAAADRMKGRLATIGKGGAFMGGLALATSGVADDMGLANSASLALMGTIAGPWGAAIGAGAGLMLDMAAANNDAEDAIRQANQAAAGATNFSEMSAAVAQATQTYDAFRASLQYDDDEWFNPSKALSRSKNFVEGLFGDSDEQEIKARSNAVSDMMFDAEQNAKSLAIALGSDFQSQTSSFTGWWDDAEHSITQTTVATEDMDAAMAAAQQAMANLDINKPFAELSDEEIAKVANEIGRLREEGEEPIDGAGLEGLTMDLRTNAEAIQENIKAMQQLRQEELAGSNAMLAYNQAVLDGKNSLKSVEDGGQNLRGSLKGVADATQAVTARQIAGMSVLNNQAAAWQGLSDEAKNVPGAFKAARKQFVDMATDLGMTRSAARRLAGELMDMPSGSAKIDTSEAGAKLRDLRKKLAEYGLTVESAKAALDDVASGRIKTVQGLINKYGITKAQAKALLDDQASGEIGRVKARLRDLDGDEATVRTNYIINTTRINTVMERHLKSGPAIADGGTVPGYADGGTPRLTGTVPGPRYPYGDSVLALLAPTEEVTTNRNGEADLFRPELKDINSGMSRRDVATRMLARGLANGGTADGSLADIERALTRNPRGTAASMARSGDTLRVEVGGTLRGTMRTPMGLMDFEADIREIARQEMDAQDRWEGGLDR